MQKTGISTPVAALRARVIARLLGVLLLAGCSPGESLPPLANYDGIHYRLGVGDQVRLITYGAEQLSGSFRLNDAGDIELPLLGTFHAAGLSTEQLRDALTVAFERRKLLNRPNIAAEVLEYRPIFVLGEVNRPGQYNYQPGMKMLTAVAIAGGFTYRAVQGRAEVLRSVGGPPVTGRVDPDEFIAPGDVITILERFF
jgi:polysaccharide biosynthesis/export protein